LDLVVGFLLSLGVSEKSGFSFLLVLIGFVADFRVHVGLH
jgi:hypothetical protein